MARYALAVAAAAAAAMYGCGGASTRQFKSSQVPFTFNYPSALKSCGTFGGSIAVLGWCMSEPIFGITAGDYVAVGRYTGDAVSLPRLRSRLAALVPSAWSSVATERHSGLPMVVARAERKPGYPRSGYFFQLGGGIWRIDCASSPTHLHGSEAACRQAVESIKPSPG